ncbi:hypothetical protein [Catellatospora tritici]|uniref:hypothetical protein n=1 Tax=Catellatospora tritici TaxID=2851566 RepID=UPI001C2DED70|nr:hypothetical protein [Catellatospora tritici]MBV1856080.1 hypothetical protein [Catellatospora tritici]
MRDAELLNAVRSWIDARQTDAAAADLISGVEESSGDRSPRSISWILEGPETMGQLVVWEDGRAELDLADIVQGQAQTEQQFIPDRDELYRILERVWRWVDR